MIVTKILVLSKSKIAREQSECWKQNQKYEEPGKYCKVNVWSGWAFMVQGLATRFNLSCKQQTLVPPTDKSRSLPPLLIFQVDSKRPGHDTGVKIQNI